MTVDRALHRSVDPRPPAPAQFKPPDLGPNRMEQSWNKGAQTVPNLRLSSSAKTA
jgi:hypothetical protein